MQFILYNKTPEESDIITQLLYEEKIFYKVKKKVVEHHFIYEDDLDNDDFCIVDLFYDIYVFTDLVHFDFIKFVAEKKITNRLQLEQFYMLKPYKKKARRKYVRQISKKNITNTNNRNKDE